MLERFATLVLKIEDGPDFEEALQDEALSLGASLVNYSALCYKRYERAVLLLRRIESDVNGADSDYFTELDWLQPKNGGCISPCRSFDWLVTHGYVGSRGNTLKQSMSILCFVVSRFNRDARKRDNQKRENTVKRFIKHWVFWQQPASYGSFKEFQDSPEHSVLIAKLEKLLDRTKKQEAASLV